MDIDYFSGTVASGKTTNMIRSVVSEVDKGKTCLFFGEMNYDNFNSLSNHLLSYVDNYFPCSVYDYLSDVKEVVDNITFKVDIVYIDGYNSNMSSLVKTLAPLGDVKLKMSINIIKRF